ATPRAVGTPLYATDRGRSGTRRDAGQCARSSIGRVPPGAGRPISARGTAGSGRWSPLRPRNRGWSGLFPRDLPEVAGQVEDHVRRATRRLVDEANGP